MLSLYQWYLAWHNARAAILDVNATAQQLATAHDHLRLALEDLTQQATLAAADLERQLQARKPADWAHMWDCSDLLCSGQCVGINCGIDRD